jgi:hypothetical protein
MNVSINFPSEIETVLLRRAAAAGQDVESFIRKVVADSLAETDIAVPPRKQPAEFRKRLESWIALHPKLEHAIDDSRESIYAGRGE